MVIIIMEYDEDQIDDDGYEQDDNADNVKMIVMLLKMCGHDDDVDGVDMMIMKVVMVLFDIIRPICYHNQMKKMISIYDGDDY